ncbi:MAG: phospho-N-acetylmuramoyl-pentapeptide-transferase, partial [Chlamydiota bacterium]
MLLLLFEYLKALGVKVPTAFAYSSTRMLFAAMTSLVMTILLGPFVINKLYSLKTGQSIRVEDCPLLAQLHEKKKETPTMGGILILFSMVASLFLWMDLKSPFTLILFVTTVWLGVLGGYDDYLKMRYKNSKGLLGKKKLFLQLLLAALIGGYLLLPSVTEFFHVGDWFIPAFAKQNASVFSMQEF